MSKFYVEALVTDADARQARKTKDEIARASIKEKLHDSVDKLVDCAKLETRDADIAPDALLYRLSLRLETI